MKTYFRIIKFLLVVMIFFTIKPVVTGQQILLDKPTNAGELTLFPEVLNENEYYYIVNQPALSVKQDGTPDFSFLRYAENVESKSGDPDNNKAEGGGIIHVVMKLHVTDEQKREAEQALRRINPNGTIVGPVLFRSGTVTLVSSAATENNEFSEQVIGMGPAPILDNGSTAFSLTLTKKGAQVLWQSFQSPTPDFSVSYNMEVAGFLSPKKLKIEANWDQIYQHSTFQAAVATPVLTGEINTAFEDLRKSGAIKVTNLGADENMEEVLKTTYNKLLQMMMDPVGGTGNPDLNQLTNTGSEGKSMLDRATDLLKTARQETTERNKAIDARNQEIDQKNEQIIQRNNAITTGKPVENQKSDGEEGKEKSLKEKLLDRLFPDEEEKQNKKEDSLWVNNVKKAETSPDNPNRVPQPQLEKEEKESLPKLAAAVSYKMKKIRQQGNYTIEFDKITPTNLFFNFSRNLGNIQCALCFKEVNLDDPLYVQREINITFDGMNASDFSKYINSVNVLLRKKHESGTLTLKEVKIDRQKFNEEANLFKMLYGWKGDNNRENWLNYDYKISWNFFGGHSVSTDWETTNEGILPLSPPLLRRTIDIEADPTLLSNSDVRAVEVKVYYEVNNQQQIKRVVLNPAKNVFASQLDIISAPDAFEYDYEITWNLRTGNPVHSGKTTSTSSILFADNL